MSVDCIYSLVVQEVVIFLETGSCPGCLTRVDDRATPPTNQDADVADVLT
jgi:hypothetical protein